MWSLSIKTQRRFAKKKYSAAPPKVKLEIVYSSEHLFIIMWIRIHKNKTKQCLSSLNYEQYSKSWLAESRPENLFSYTFQDVAYYCLY